MSENSRGFCIFYDWLDVFRLLSKEQVGELVMAMGRYYTEGEAILSGVSAETAPIAMMIEKQIERAKARAKKEAEKCGDKETKTKTETNTYTHTETLKNKETNIRKQSTDFPSDGEDGRQEGREDSRNIRTYLTKSKGAKQWKTPIRLDGKSDSPKQRYSNFDPEEAFERALRRSYGDEL